MEIELSSSTSQLDKIQLDDSHIGVGGYGLVLGDIKFEGGGVGVGEVPIEIFNGNRLHIFRNDNEVLMKVFKLYNGYSREGYMTPVLVFLTDKTLYVTDQVRNRLCNKFVLPYSELDVILVGPYGNTVLLSNSARDMQQVLLAGGPYPADGLVSNLELCARRGGFILPAVGQLTLDHLAPLQAFVRDHSNVSREDSWKFYAVVNVPAGSIGGEDEPLGPNMKGPLMHRRMSHAGFVDQWSAGYFLLKAGVLYLFGDASQKLPTWAVALAECQGARRSLTSGRPYCFELLLRTGALQLAAPDEYVASDWLQALVQAASGLFELQERRQTLGCTLIMTSNHLLTLREDFNAPLRRTTTLSGGSACSSRIMSPAKENINPNTQQQQQQQQQLHQMSTVSTPSGHQRKLSSSNMLDTNSEISSIRSTGSTPNKLNPTVAGAGSTTSDRRSNSTTSTPTKANLLLRQNCPGDVLNSPARSYQRRPSSTVDELLGGGDDQSYTNMSSFYGKNSGVEVLTCASIDEMIAVKIPANSSNWWCILEFECQEVRETSDDLVVFFSTSSEQERFLSMLESTWHLKKSDAFPASIITSEDDLYQHCAKLFLDINRSWEPLLSAALGYPQ
ncbi:pleckstrin homology domain-containing family M member 2-like [Uranotaenia lowii]|uniref:pleckstrin homology domain-containing family M member 2-like n=1 Tax=Uranotaenia lowii TaxID=190385 RepID=UPI00247A9129|nr:pleckstrin homology domain-containing family M member 2-like [Uranotaenia lowii]